MNPSFSVQVHDQCEWNDLPFPMDAPVNLVISRARYLKGTSRNCFDPRTETSHGAIATFSARHDGIGRGNYPQIPHPAR
jgi:hypothetical protein